ncbi:MAG: ribonuclease III [Gammaproteobacteria bacterium RIFCSPHIGHO2_12_FULL_42_10]|nr:MAG: ribonuclease III [Gammaproteobacteria bacterium RIFCSPHIGHO2_12_FULL_42_10]
MDRLSQSLLDTLFSTLHYRFKDLALLKMALTHRSKGGEHNERIEFLGDAIVNMVIAEALYLKFPEAAEGELSRWRASLVNRDALAELAREFDLGRYILLGPGEIRSGGHERHSILSCTMEAVIGAIYLDGGFDAIRQCIMIWHESRLVSFSSTTSHKDPKTLLQECMQSRHASLPVYVVESTSGEAHQQSFSVSCTIETLGIKVLGTGTSRRKGEQSAALEMLTVLKQHLMR